MRGIVGSLISASLVAACISTPAFYSTDTTADAGGGAPVVDDPDAVVAPSDDDGSADAAPDEDAALDDDAAPDDDGAVTPVTPPPPPPPPSTCPTAGAPAGAQCCGADNTAPLCVGIACMHCADCVAEGCTAGMICCAVSPGKSGKYKSMACAPANLAGACP